MKKLFTVLIALLLLSMPCYAQELTPPPEGWLYMAYTEGGINLTVPEDTQFWELYPYETSMGIVALGGNADYTIQLRRFLPEEISIDDFKEMLLSEPSADVTIKESDGSVILSYRNTEPTADSELSGIMLEGLDGNVYKISIFTGESEAFAPEAPVWEIVQTIADSVSIMDFSDWPLESQ